MAAYNFRFVAGRLCLDLLNTLGDRSREQTDEHLTTYAELVRWAAEAGAIDLEAAPELLRVAARRPDAAKRVLARAVSLREALHRIVIAARQAEAPAEEDLGLFNRELGLGLAHARVRRAGGSYELGWTCDPAALDRPLWAVVRSAADLLTAGDLARVKSCASDTCDWVFLDESRNHSRQWCQMKVCGNRAKARRHYERAKARNGGIERSESNAARR